jgi:hypothetical protein
LTLFEGPGVTVLDEAGAVLDAIVVDTDVEVLVAVVLVAATVVFTVVFVVGESTKTAIPLILVCKTAFVEFILVTKASNSGVPFGAAATCCARF